MNRGSKKSAVFKYFILNDINFYVCQCQLEKGGQCSTNISAYSGKSSSCPSRTSNLKRHLKSKHPIIYKSVVEEDTYKCDIIKNSSCSTSRTGSEHQVPINNFIKDKKIKISMTTEKFKMHLIDLVLKNEVPLTLFSSPAFRGLNGEMATKLGVSLDRHDIQNMILKETEKEKTLDESIKELNQKICDSQQSNNWMASLNIDVKDEPFEFEDEFEPTESQEEIAYAEATSDSHAVFLEVNQNLEDCENIPENAHSSEGKTHFKKRTFNNVSSQDLEETQKKANNFLPQTKSIINMDQNDLILNASLDLPNLASSSVKDECSTYGEHVANKLRKLDECSRAVVQHKINSIIFEAEMKKFIKTCKQES